MIKRLTTCLAVAALFFSAIGTEVRAQSPNLVIFAAASLKNALDETAVSYAKESGKRAPKISYAASNTLVKQIEQGAPADIFISADLDWMDYAAGKGLIRPETRDLLLGNRLVLIGPKDANFSVALVPGLQLAPLMGGGRLAMGNVDAVPAGKYGKAALEKLGAWEPIRNQIAQAESVRAALLFVSRGETALGIVYRTDAAAEPGVKIVGVFPEDTHPPIIYPAALTKASANPEASAFLAYLRSPAARAAFERQGFAVLPPKT